MAEPYNPAYTPRAIASARGMTADDARRRSDPRHRNALLLQRLRTDCDGRIKAAADRFEQSCEFMVPVRVAGHMHDIDQPATARALARSLSTQGFRVTIDKATNTLYIDWEEAAAPNPSAQLSAMWSK